MSLKAIVVKIGARVGMCGLEQRPERTACQLTKAHASHPPTEQLVVEHIWAAHRANGADQQAASGRGKREEAGQDGDDRDCRGGLGRSFARLRESRQGGVCGWPETPSILLGNPDPFLLGRLLSATCLGRIDQRKASRKREGVVGSCKASPFASALPREATGLAPMSLLRYGRRE